MRRFVTENLGWKLLSVWLAVILWLAFVGDVGDPELATSAWAPVQYKNIPKDLEMSSDVIDRVHLELLGPAGKLSVASLAEAAVVFDLAGVRRAGERTFTIGQSNLRLPEGVVLSRAVPAQVRLQFEPRLSTEVPVQLRVSSPPPHGYEMEPPVITPSSLRIVGPRARVRRIQAVHTDPLDLSAVSGERTFQVPTYVADPQVRFESVPMVEVRIQVRPVR